MPKTCAAGICLIVAIFLPSSLIAADVVLAWDANSETDLAGYKVYYGTVSRTYGSPVTVGNTTTYTAQNLAPGTYYFTVTAYNTAGAESGYSNEVSTTIGQSDTTPPVISAVISGSITTSGATIIWTTDEASDSQVDYGISPTLGSSTVLNAVPVTSHSQALAGLNPGTLYYYRVKSRDTAGNLAASAGSTFTTAIPADTTPPVISSVSAGSITTSGATITWTTNEASNSQVEYGTSPSLGNSTAVNASLATGHSQALAGLNPGTLYYYRVKSRDAAGNLATSANASFSTTVSCTASVSPTIQTFAQAGGNQAVSVTVGGGCAWAATSSAPWISISAGANGSGNGTVAYSVDANATGAPRTGTMTVAGQTVTITQQGSPSCDLTSDGITNVLDIQLLINVILGTVPNAGNADFNRDGRVDGLDLQLLSNIVLGVRGCS